VEEGLQIEGGNPGGDGRQKRTRIYWTGSREKDGTFGPLLNEGKWIPDPPVGSCLRQLGSRARVVGAKLPSGVTEG